MAAPTLGHQRQRDAADREGIRQASEVWKWSPPDEVAEINAALRGALHRLAPLGGRRRLHVHAAADALTSLLADLLARTPEVDVECVVALFREKMLHALAAGRERRH